MTDMDDYRRHAKDLANLHMALRYRRNINSRLSVRESLNKRRISAARVIAHTS